MRLAIYGGTFNPPHLGHLKAAKAAIKQLCPDKLIMIPTSDPPHKSLAQDTPSATDRMRLLELTVSGLSDVEVSSMEIDRAGKSYTAGTIRELFSMYGDVEIFLLIGTDMLETFEQWNDFQWLLSNVKLAAFSRKDGDKTLVAEHSLKLSEKYGADITLISISPLCISSTILRKDLAERKGLDFLAEPAYGYIIKKRLYGSKPALSWLREKTYARLDPKRISHVKGCEQEALNLARHWGADPGDAAEAAILHDISKNLSHHEQLILCKKYDIMTDGIEINTPKLLHAKTGAYIARDEFGVNDAVFNAILWHTTARPHMSLLEKVIYLADYIEPNRTFEGVTALRKLAYEDIDKAMALGLEMSLSELLENGQTPHNMSASALQFFKTRRECTLL